MPERDPESFCPICLRPATIRRSLDRASIAAAHAPPARDRERFQRMLHEVERLYPGDVYACVCDACRLGFAWPVVEGDERFYALLHERAGYPRERWEFRHVRETFVRSGARVLDVGAGRGDFLRSLPDTVDRHAVEASRTLCDVLRTRGVTAHESPVDAATAAPFDLITGIHVLQYFADPVAVLARLASMLAPGGRLVLSVPNAEAAGDAIDRLDAPPHPLTRWSRLAIDRATARAGLTIDAQLWIPRPISGLAWAAYDRTRKRAIEKPDSLAARVDALPPGKPRTLLLALLSAGALPTVLPTAHGRLRRSQMLVVCRPV